MLRDELEELRQLGRARQVTGSIEGRISEQRRRASIGLEVSAERRAVRQSWINTGDGRELGREQVEAEAEAGDQAAAVVVVERWERRFTEDGEAYYVSLTSGASQWDVPEHWTDGQKPPPPLDDADDGHAAAAAAAADDDDEEEEEDDDDDDDDDAEVEHSEDDMRMQEFRQDGQEAKKALKNAEELAEEEDEQDDDDGDELDDYGGVRLGDASPWFELTVAETGELYYFNEDTGETSWGHPTGAGRSSDQASDSPEDSADTAHGKDLGEVASTAFGGMVFVGKVVLWRRSRGFGIVHPLGRRDDLQESEEEAGGVATEPWRFPVFAHVKQVRGRKHLSTGSRVLFSMRHRPDATLRKGRKKWEAYDLRRG